MMQAFRSSGKIVMTIVAVLFVVFFLVIDLSGIASGGPGLFSRTSVGKVEGQSVDRRSYEAAVQQAIETRQRQAAYTLSLEETQRVRDEVWESFVQDIVLEKELDRYGVHVTDQEVAAAVSNVPPQELLQDPLFQTDGQFDLSKWQTWLTSTQGSAFVPVLEAQYRREIARGKLLQVVTADVYLSDGALWQRWKDENETARIGLASVSARSMVADTSVAVSDEAVRTWYDEHREELEQPAAAWLSYVAIPRFTAPSDTAAARDRAAALRQEILDGAPFAEVAQRESSDQGSARRGGSLGTFARGAMVPSFDSAAAALPIGELSPPVQTDFGFHIIEVTARTTDSITAQHILVPVELAGARRDSIESRADSLESIGAERLDPAALDTASAVLGLPILTAGPVNQGAAVQVGRFVVPDAGVWAFRAEEGETSPVIETETAYYVFRLDRRREAGIPPLADVRDQVIDALRDEQKLALARPIAEGMVRRIREGSTLQAAAEAVGAPYRELGPFRRVQPPIPVASVIGAAFGLPVGRTSTVLEDEGTFYLVHVLERAAPDSAVFVSELESYRLQQINLARQERVRGYLQGLREAATVVDRRAELDRTNAQLEAELGAVPQPGGI